MELGKEYPGPNEEARTKAIVDAFRGMSRRKYPDGIRPMLRDAHTKSNGLVRARLTVLPTLPEPARHGLFRTPATYETWIRFSNAFSSVQADRNIDVRGMALKVMGVEGEKLLDRERNEKTQDFLLINFPVFFSPNLPEYVEFSEEYVKEENPARYLLQPGNLRQAFTLYRAGRGNMVNPLTARYWSSVPYKLGPAAVKYSARPSDGVVERKKAARSAPDDFLRRAMVAHLDERDAEFDFMVQFQTDADRMPVEDPSIEWQERDTPFITVAKIRIPRQEFDTDRQNDYAEHLSFNPWHSLPDHRPIGAVNRVRKVVYEEAAALRHTENDRERREPAGFADFDG